jgi:hypothetical protein
MKLATLIVGGSMILAAAPAFAGPVGECVSAAKGEYKTCTDDTKEALQVAKDACRGKDHDCVEQCRGERMLCRAETGFDGAMDACQATLDTARANCKIAYPTPGPDRDTCVDQAQVEAFQCRDTARETHGPALKACRAAFQDCVKACPDSGLPADDPKQCKADAKAAYRVSKADCREDFQLDKDICRGLDHSCVEGCRTGRADCRAPVQAPLDAAIAACNDQAQVVAFICRDDAREAARPGFHACRDAFHACVIPACQSGSPSLAFVD